MTIRNTHIHDINDHFFELNQSAAQTTLSARSFLR